MHLRVVLAWLAVGAAVSVTVVAAYEARQDPPPAFSVVELGIEEMQAGMEQGHITSRTIVEQYLRRIAFYENVLHATLSVNRRALEEADERDRERVAGHVRGPLHGIPIALKDNIQTVHLPTTGGMLAFAGYVPPYEATVTANLREAGAIVLAKTGMTELANWIAGPPTPMPANYNALGGFSFNPYDPRRDPRPGLDGRPVLSTGGSSSGGGTAANLWAANVGTETSGSILSPSNQNMLAAVKPTVGRISRHGVMPITAEQDTPGPMAKSVRDAAILLGALEGARPDPHDPATTRCTPPSGNDYRPFLQADGLRGARIGIPRAYFYTRVRLPGRSTALDLRGGLTDVQSAVMNRAIAVLEREGAVVVDPADVSSVVADRVEDNFLLWDVCSGAHRGREGDTTCSVGFKYGMKRDFNRWLASLGESAPVRSLTELREWNRTHAAAGSLRYGQANLDISDEMDVGRDRARFEADRDKDLRLSAASGIDAIMKQAHLDALLFPGASGAGLAARAGYPTVMVPFGMVPNDPESPFPAGFVARPQPYGISFTGLACSESRLIELAFAFEQATQARRSPAATP